MALVRNPHAQALWPQDRPVPRQRRGGVKQTESARQWGCTNELGVAVVRTGLGVAENTSLVLDPLFSSSLQKKEALAPHNSIPPLTKE